MQSYLAHLECTACHQTYPTDQFINTCPECGKVIYARYDLQGAARAMTPEALSGRPWNLWRYFEILPLQDETNAISRGQGGTPLLPAPALGGLFGLERFSEEIPGVVREVACVRGGDPGIEVLGCRHHRVRGPGIDGPQVVFDRGECQLNGGDVRGGDRRTAHEGEIVTSAINGV